MTSPPDPYAILEVSRDARDPVIAAAYRVLSKQVHPDLAHGPADRGVREVRMRELNAARDLLLSAPARTDIDRRLAEDDQARLESLRRGAVEAELARQGFGRPSATVWPTAGHWPRTRPVSPTTDQASASTVPDRGRWMMVYVLAVSIWLAARSAGLALTLGIDGCVGVVMISSLIVAPVVVLTGITTTIALLSCVALLTALAALGAAVIAVGADIRTAAKMLRAWRDARRLDPL